MTDKEFEVIEKLIYKANDDIAVSIARSFERMAERIDAMESRLYSRINELDDAIEVVKDQLAEIEAGAKVVEGIAINK